SSAARIRLGDSARGGRLYHHHTADRVASLARDPYRLYLDHRPRAQSADAARPLALADLRPCRAADRDHHDPPCHVPCHGIVHEALRLLQYRLALDDG